MTSYSPPRINTDKRQHDWLPEPLSNALGKLNNRVVVVPGDISYQHVGGMAIPDVPRSYGWHWPQQLSHLGTTYMRIKYGAPNVMQYSTAYKQKIAEAASPKQTNGATGVYTALRAPGINEGY